MGRAIFSRKVAWLELRAAGKAERDDLL